MIAASEEQSAVLICNPRAGRVTPHVVEDVTERLATRYDLKVVTTLTRRHGIELAAQAAEEGFPTVIALGGDGHVNEVVNGMVGSSSTLAILPGGTMNVYARSLGIPRRLSASIDHLLRLDRAAARPCDLGVMDDVHFTFAGGCGFDAEVARLVESHLASKRRFGEPYFYWSALRILSRRTPSSMLVDLSGTEVEVQMAVVCCGGPYAYLFGLPVRLVPSDERTESLDLVALTRLKVTSIPWYAFRATFGGSVSAHRDAVSVRGLDRVSIRAEKPFARHVDGEPLGSTDAVEFRSAPAAVQVLA